MYLIKKRVFQLLIGCCASFLLVNNALASDDDPWEKFNRSVFAFNDQLDRAILKPVAKVYDNVMPTPVKKGTSNFFSNLGEVSNTVNNLLQFKLGGTAASGSRFLINSTIGIFGIFDVASMIGIDKKGEDFGQTLGYWGVGNGPFLMVPFFGPSTIRDGTGLVFDYEIGEYVYDQLDLTWKQDLGLNVLNAVQKRASLLSLESMMMGDKYSFMRDVYLQNRANEVRDGKREEDQSSDSWGDDSDAGGGWGDEDIDYGDDDGTSAGWGDEVIDYGDDETSN